jgi:hypothetical protein
MAWDFAMNAVVASVLKYEAARAELSTRSFNVVVYFSAFGLLVSFCVLTIGLYAYGGSF